MSDPVTLDEWYADRQQRTNADGYELCLAVLREVGVPTTERWPDRKCRVCGAEPRRACMRMAATRKRWQEGRWVPMSAPHPSRLAGENR